MAKIISRVKEFAKSEKVRNFTKGVLKGAAVVGGVILAYKVGKSVGSSAMKEQLTEALGDIACSKYGNHCEIDSVNIREALDMWIKPDDVMDFVKEKIS